MILRITDSNEDFGDDTYKVSLENFSNKVYHPMIATTKWDVVYVDITDKTPRGILMQVIKNARVVPVMDKNTVSMKMVQVLCEILPDEAFRLRTVYRQGKWEFIKFLEQLEEEYWRV